jgi:hypothetical protein
LGWLRRDQTRRSKSSTSNFLPEPADGSDLRIKPVATNVEAKAAVLDSLG